MNDDWREILTTVETVLGVMVLAYMVWQLVPSVRLETLSWWQQARHAIRVKRETERAQNELAWHVYSLIHLPEGADLAKELEPSD